MNIRRYLLVFLIAQIMTQAAFARHNAATDEFASKAEFQDGRDYFSYRSPIKIDRHNDERILIQSFFDYDCRVCVNTQDILAIYSQINSNSVVVEEYPVATKETPFSARVYYSLRQMGHQDISDSLLFETVDSKRYRELAKYDNLLKWLKEQQVDAKHFDLIYRSDDINKKLSEAIYRTENYGVFTYPFVVIEGKYVLTNSTLYNDDYTFAVLDFLVHKLSSEKEEKESQ